LLRLEHLDRHAAAPRLNHTPRMGAGQWIMPLVSLGIYLFKDEGGRAAWDG
jgi:hypothetical protein